MTDRMKDMLLMLGMFIVLVLFFSKLLFTDKIIRAPDIINEFYWGVKDAGLAGLADQFTIQLSAGWSGLVNSGYSVEGGDVSMQFLLWKRLIFWGIPAPASVAWFIVIQMFFGAYGTYLCCRTIGASRPAAFLGGLIFALAPENASLINAGHVMKIATISYAPWAFYLLERGFQTRRLIFFLSSAFVLAFQFFNTHWQIAYYTCLCLGAYGIVRLISVALSEGEEERRLLPRLFGLNIVLLAFFLTTVSISLLPLTSWSTDTNRGVKSGVSQTAGSTVKGGLDVEEAMSWSMPPEEMAAFIIPGLFGLSRQEAGPNPSTIAAYYWGRMRFTQTVSYMGLVPWLLLPLPLIFRRDRYTWLPLGGLVGGILFSLGKYTPFYWGLYKFFPGINHFRVPKMMMFIPVLCLALLAARGVDLVMDEQTRNTKQFQYYLRGAAALPLLLLVLLAGETGGATYWMNTFSDALSQPTRYEQGAYLIKQRWDNIVTETAIAAGLAAVCAAALWIMSRSQRSYLLPWFLAVLFVGDVGRINGKFLFLVDAPVKAGQADSAPPLMAFLKSSSPVYRVLPMDGGDPMHYVSHGIPVMYTSNPVQQVRWQQFLDSFSLTGPMLDILNVKYLVMSYPEYQQQKVQMGERFVPVYTDMAGNQIVLENRTVLPKAWLVPAAVVVNDPAQRLAILQNPGFNPREVAIVEHNPPLTLQNPKQAAAVPAQVRVPVYQGNRIVVDAPAPTNALLVLGEKYYKGWKAAVDGAAADIVPVNHVLRGVYLTPGTHTVEFVFDPLPFKVGKYLTLASFALFAAMLVREWIMRRKTIETP